MTDGLAGNLVGHAYFFNLNTPKLEYLGVAYFDTEARCFIEPDGARIVPKPDEPEPNRGYD